MEFLTYRIQLLDKDNLYGGSKFHIDALRYAGVIADDDAKTLDLVVRQEKVSQKAQERTVITLTSLG